MLLTRTGFLVVGLLVLATQLPGQVRLPKIFTDNMVLQQQLPIPIWGWAKPDAEVSVEFAGATARATADGKGRWRVNLPSLPADGETHVLRVVGSTTVELKNVVLGEVWLCAGQSNMNREAKVRDSDEDIRLFWIDGSVIPRRDNLGDQIAGWVASTPAEVAKATPSVRRGKAKRRDGFAEVGYVFGKRLHRELNVPVGLIKCAFGGSQVRAWIPDPELPKRLPFESAATGSYLGHRPGLLYRSMVHGIVPFSVRGVLWYQGENDGRSKAYHLDLARWITSWRALWGRPEMPFYMTQIAPTTYAGGRMQYIWEAQSFVTRHVPHTALAVSNDIYLHGKRPAEEVIDADHKLSKAMRPSNPHPPNKHVVAERLAAIALVETYHKATRIRYGPEYESHEIRGATVRVTFRNVGDGLRTRDGALPNWFELSDGSLDKRRLRFQAAQAKIVAPNVIEVTAEGMSAPKHVRFGWHCIAIHNLQNSAGLPAISFRTGDTIRDHAPLRFVTYNIHGTGPVASSPTSKAALRLLRGGRPMHQVLARELAHLKADVIALQEAKSQAFVKKLAAAMGMHWAYFPGGWQDASKGWPEGIPTAILSRHKIQTTENCPLVNHKERPKDLFTRGYGKVVISTRQGEIAVFVAHLLPAWKNTTHIRTGEIVEIAAAAKLERDRDRSVVVLGDMNLRPSMPEYPLWPKHGFVDCVALVSPGGDQFTCPTKNPSERIDYVFASGPIVTRLRTATVWSSGVWGIQPEDPASFALSDHLPVVAEFGPAR